MPSRRELANAIRALAMDAVQAANSGHPGMPMGMADIAEVLYNDYLKHNPANPQWWDRDRFVISNGHGSMLQYAVLHLSGYDLPLEELKNFRQLHSATPGHPEYGETPGVETTTGPLGQGVANAVGMALAEKLLAARFNRDDHPVIDHRTWLFLGDGCLMEGISHEACSLAGTLGLGKLVAFWDDNGISIDGKVEGWFTDNTPDRFRAYGWQVIEHVDGHDPVEISTAINTALKSAGQPTLICTRTTIGYGSPTKAGTAATHGAPLGEEEVEATREALDWPHEAFDIPEEIYAGWDAKDEGETAENAWNVLWESYQDTYPDLADELRRRMRGELPQEWPATAHQAIESAQSEGQEVATRKASQIALEALAPALPELIGGSADLAGSNNTIWSGSVDVNEDPSEGNYIYFGVREFGMTALANGLALHGGFLPYVATFLVFSDYARNAVRMSALIPAQTIHVYTHDSIGLGEDGPTHQPIEHLASLRLIPDMELWRPCDVVESIAAWRAAIERKGRPSILVFTRQGVPHQARNPDQVTAIERGAYVLHEPEGDVDAIILATGSEVGLAMDAASILADANVAIRVVSMPCVERFLAQDAAYQDTVLPAAIDKRVAVEAGVSHYWKPFVGSRGRVVGIDQFGASAPGEDLFEHFGMTVDAVVDAVKAQLN